MVLILVAIDRYARIGHGRLFALCIGDAASAGSGWS